MVLPEGKVVNDRHRIHTREMLKGNLLEPLDFPPRAEIREMILVEVELEDASGKPAVLIYEKDGRLVAVSDPRQESDYSK